MPGSIMFFSKKQDSSEKSIISEKSLARASKGISDLHSSLHPEDSELLKAQTATETPKVNIFTLYRFATAFDIVILTFGVFFALVSGAAFPMFTLVVGGITNNFRNFAAGVSTPEELTHKVNHNCLYFIYIAIGLIGSGFLSALIFNNRGDLIASRYRKEYLRAIIRQNIGYFDHLGSGSVATRITNDTASLQSAISDRVVQLLKAIATLVAAIVIALATYWKLALIGLSAVVWFAFHVSFNGAMLGKFAGRAEGIYAQGSNIAEESISAARNSIAISAQSKLVQRFDAYLQKSHKVSNRASIHKSLMMAVMGSTLGFLYALVTWEGFRLIRDGDTSVGKLITVMVSLLLGMFNFAGLAPQIMSLSAGFSAAKSLNETINRVPVIDTDATGVKPEWLEGTIKFDNVQFRYPSRPDVLVLPNFSLKISPGETVALVGPSGSGKSTVIGLLERFYLPLNGSISVDGIEIQDFDLKWLRQHIGLVSQEPTLFAASIAENISYGLIGTKFENSDDETKRHLVIDACKQANAWDFIQTLDQGLDTNVGERGFLLSGGQKQRIVIARAIISDPKILLLDEATSALDTKSEGIVQDALEKASSSRTTIVIAHRLSTIKNADRIVVMSKGEIIEQGTHHELLAANGTYANLVEMQSIKQGEKKRNEITIQEDEFVEESSDFVATPIPGLEKRKHSYVDVIKFVLEYNKNQIPRLSFALITSCAIGYAVIGFAMLLGKYAQTVMVPPSLYASMMHRVNTYAWFFFMVGMLQIIFVFLSMMAMNTANDHLLHNVRRALFRQLMRMDIAFFDVDKNTPGALVSVLARDGKAIEALGGATMGQILQTLATIIGGLVTGIAFNWKLGLVATACVPILFVSGFCRVKILGRLEASRNAAYERSGGLATSFTNTIRTVQTLTRENQVTQEYNSIIDAQVAGAYGQTFFAALFFGISEGMFPLVLALIWYYGGQLLSKHEIQIFHYYVVFLGTIIGTVSATMIFQYIPDLAKAKTAAENAINILDANPLIDTQSSEGTTLEVVQGAIRLDNVHFRYPTRPQVPVLRGVNLNVLPGQTVALVGASGCGKSTVVGLADRFYDPDAGSIYLDGIDFREFNVNNLRSHISMVQQEPTLYSGTIRDNLLLGWPGEDSEVTQGMLEEACMEANAHDFIVSLPEGYDTEVGGHGALLSGGQKQRIAIARALLKKPKVLLLDEATSALDAESEKVVQAALDKASKGRTTIAIAHRLSTIQGSDVIYVFDRGRIVEQGTHHELLALNGRYSELVSLQNLQE